MCAYYATKPLKQASVFHMDELRTASSLTFMGTGLKGNDHNNILNIDGWT